MNRRLMMVDDEETLIWTTQRQIQRQRPDLVFEGYSDPLAALARLREQPPDLLVTDLRMPQLDGVELLSAAREVRPHLPVIVVTAYGTAELRSELQRRPSVEYLEKPFTFARLMEAADRLLSRAAGFSGAIELPMLPDLIQIYALSRASGALRIVRGDQAGAIWFEGGEVLHAVCGSLDGAEAFYALLGWEGGSFAMRAGDAPPQRSITTSWQELLMEGCRRLDEARAGHGAPEAPADSATPSSGRAAELAACLREQAGSELLAGLALALDLAVGRGVYVDDCRAADPAGAGAARGLIESVGALGAAADEGSVEWVSSELALSVVWDARAGLAVVYGDAVQGPLGGARYRSLSARWRSTFTHAVRALEPRGSQALPDSEGRAQGE